MFSAVYIACILFIVMFFLCICFISATIHLVK